MVINHLLIGKALQVLDTKTYMDLPVCVPYMVRLQDVNSPSLRVSHWYPLGLSDIFIGIGIGMLFLLGKGILNTT